MTNRSTERCACMQRVLASVAACVASVAAGCTHPAFVLTDDAAMDRVMSSAHVSRLQERNPTRLMCMVDGREPNAIDVYVGEDHPDHTVRVATFRVTDDGRVWVNDDQTGLEASMSDAQVRSIIVDLWTPDKDIEQGA